MASTITDGMAEDDTVVSEAALWAALGDLVRAVPGDGRPRPTGVLGLLAHHTQAVLGSSAAVATLVHDGRITTSTGSLDEDLQEAANRGPGKAVVDTAALVTSLDLGTEDRWPEFCWRAVARDLRTLAALPIATNGHLRGTLIVCWSEADRLAENELEAGRLLADMGAGCLESLQTVVEARDLSERLQQELDRRVLVEQASGMLAERYGIDPDVAVEALHERARSRDEPLHRVALRVLAAR